MGFRDQQQQDRDRNSGTAGINTGTSETSSIGSNESEPIPSFEFPTGATGSTGMTWLDGDDRNNWLGRPRQFQ